MRVRRHTFFAGGASWKVAQKIAEVLSLLLRRGMQPPPSLSTRTFAGSSPAT